jgi:hypothetical protein
VPLAFTRGVLAFELLHTIQHPARTAVEVGYFRRVRDEPPAADVRSAEGIAGANASRAAPMTLNKAPATSRSPRSLTRWMAMTAMTEACAKLDQDAKRITRRFTAGLRAASSRNIPSGEYRLIIIGKASSLFRWPTIPYRGHHGIVGSGKEQSHQHQHNLQRSFSKHGVLRTHKLIALRVA